MSLENFEHYIVTDDETRILFLKMIEQSIRDYINLANSTVPIEIQYHQSAKAFLLDETYFIQWGKLDINIENILDYLQIEHEWFYRKLEIIIESRMK